MTVRSEGPRGRTMLLNACELRLTLVAVVIYAGKSGCNVEMLGCSARSQHHHSCLDFISFGLGTSVLHRSASLLCKPHLRNALRAEARVLQWCGE